MIGSLYFHIPFCKKKCPYCHFFVVKTNESLVAQYMHAVKREWELKKKYTSSFKEIASIYFGGGTPSQLSAEHLHQLITLVKQDCKLSPDVEITIEVNPEDATKELFQQYAAMGINRISLGVQSLHLGLLEKIGRNHSAQESLLAIQHASDAGIDNISVDLMYDLPHQKLEYFKHTIDVIEHLPVRHLSLYNLVIEPNTVFEKNKKLLTPHLPSEDDSYDMLDYAVKKLLSFGFKRYEISAFAKGDHLSIHNTGYWQGRPFIGFGPSAFSYKGGSRFQNHANLKSYFQDIDQGIDPISFSETLPFPSNIQELLAIRLRMLDGFSLSEYPLLPPLLMKNLSDLQEDGFVQISDDHIKLTEKGANFYDTIASTLV